MSGLRTYGYHSASYSTCNLRLFFPLDYFRMTSQVWRWAKVYYYMTHRKVYLYSVPFANR